MTPYLSLLPYFRNFSNIFKNLKQGSIQKEGGGTIGAEPFL